MAFVKCVPLPKLNVSTLSPTSLSPPRCPTCPTLSNRVSCALPSPSQKALIFDCDGVIVESEELHRISYNQCWQQENLSFQWSTDFYEMLQNSIGGGKEKMRWYFDKYGWPDSKPPSDPAVQQQRDAFINHLHKQKTLLYKKLILDGQASVRPGVLRLMDEAHQRGLKLAICSAANAQAVQLVLDTMLGEKRLSTFDLILAGDVVSKKKPHPMIYNVARDKLAVQPNDCVVIEDSQIGLRAALDAGMRVVITHTPYTASQSFQGAAAVYASLGDLDTDDKSTIVTVDQLFPELVAVTPR